MTYLEFNTRTGFNVGDALHSICAKHARESERKWNEEISANSWRRRRERLEGFAIVFMFMTLFQPIQTLSIVFSDFVFDPNNDSLAYISFFIGIIIYVMLLKIGFVLKTCIRSENRNFISGLYFLVLNLGCLIFNITYTLVKKKRRDIGVCSV